jgi:uncharacterized protein
LLKNRYLWLVKLILFISLFTNFILVRAQVDLAQLDQYTSRSLEARKEGLKDQRGFARSRNPLKTTGNSLIWVYQKIFSEQLNAGCSFHPSCSSYGKQAIGERGLLMGILLTADRLTRCNGAAQIESEAYLVDKKTGKLNDEPRMYRLSR